jgi:hypothetical protein
LNIIGLPDGVAFPLIINEVQAHDDDRMMVAIANKNSRIIVLYFY